MIANLCDTCAFRELVRTARGSTFVLCNRSRLDPRFPKYPPQPIIRCVGYEATDQPE